MARYSRTLPVHQPSRAGHLRPFRPAACRYVKSQQLWACLAAMAVSGKELHTAEVAYAAIDQVDKLLYMCHIKELPTVEAREAELLLFRRRQAEAVQVLVQGGWVYRAIKLFIRVFQWEKAFELCAAARNQMMPWHGPIDETARHSH